MHLFYSKKITNGTIILDEEECHHCNHVLRLQKGDLTGVLDGKGNLYKCKISQQGKKINVLEILSVEYSYPDLYYIHIAVAPTKSIDRMEWFVEKATELGIQEISFLYCTNSERAKINIDRLEKKLINALKQSQNRYLPQINPIQPYTAFIQSDLPVTQKFIARISDPPDPELSRQVIPGEKYLIMIGPEGDFTAEEVNSAINKKFIPVSLGKSRLRTETAALAGAFTFLIMNQKESR